MPKGDIANVEIGVEVKIFSKAMVKQLGRVTNDLREQVDQFHTRATNPVCIGIVGINCAEYYVSFLCECCHARGQNDRHHEVTVDDPRLCRGDSQRFDRERR